jgi:hypothetical protein
MANGVTQNLNSSIFPPNHPGKKFDDQMAQVGAHQPVPMPPGMGILFINGMLNDLLDKNESVVDISHSLGDRAVEHVFNDTWSVEKTIGEVSAKILEMEQGCRRELERAGLTKDISIVIIAHSHGAGILERSLEDTRIAPLKRNIRIVTIGGAALIPFLGYKSATNLIHEMDFLPLIAHRDIDVEQLSTDSSQWNFFINFLGDFKRRFQEDVLKLTSHKNPALADRIWSTMQFSMTASPQQTPLETAVNSLCQDIIKMRNKHLNLQTVTNQNLERFSSDILSVVIAHMTYKIEISKTPMQPMSSLNQYLEVFHSVKSYTLQLSPLVKMYIEAYEKVVVS